MLASLTSQLSRIQAPVLVQLSISAPMKHSRGCLPALVVLIPFCKANPSLSTVMASEPFQALCSTLGIFPATVCFRIRHFLPRLSQRRVSPLARARSRYGSPMRPIRASSLQQPCRLCHPLFTSIPVQPPALTPASIGPMLFPDLARPALLAALPGQTICVATGTYYPTSGTGRTSSFYLKDGVEIEGAFAGFGAPNPNIRDTVNTPTILSGDIGSLGNNTDNSYHVIYANGVDATANVDVITIANGNDNGNSEPTGGGVYIVSGSPTITNCTFVANASASGAGIFIGGYSASLVTGCSFNDDSANSGAGIYVASYASPLITACAFNGDTSTFGAIYSAQYSNTSIINCSFSSVSGGGICANAATITVTGSKASCEIPAAMAAGLLVRSVLIAPSPPSPTALSLEMPTTQFSMNQRPPLPIASSSAILPARSTGRSQPAKSSIAPSLGMRPTPKAVIPFFPSPTIRSRPISNIIFWGDANTLRFLPSDLCRL